MSKSDEFYTFEEAVKELKIFEDELKKMVSEGEITAFKDEDKLKFRKEDVVAKKSENITDPTVVLESDESEIPVSPTDETFVDDTSNVQATDIDSDTDIHVPDLMEEADVTTPLDSIEETVADIGGEEISPDDTIIDDSATATVPEEPAPEETISDIDQTVHIKTKAPRPRKKISRFASPALEREMVYSESISVTTAVPKFKTPVIFIALLGVVLLFLILVGSFIGDSLRISSGRGKYPIGITRDFGQMVLDMVGIKKEDANLDKFKKEE
ncbi:MAG: helix-turn-helix domain-containing protein [Planctomycetota bacterium]